MGNKVKDNREEQRIAVFNSLNSGIDFNKFHPYEQEAILKAMQEYADLRCKPLVEALEDIISYSGVIVDPLYGENINQPIYEELKKSILKAKNALQDYKK